MRDIYKKQKPGHDKANTSSPAIGQKTDPTKAERIAKRIARAGICSRRDAERLIEEGEVIVNGEVINSPALNVTAKDEIIVKGKKLAAPETARLWRYYKPRDLVVSAKDEKGRETIFDNLPENLPRVVSVGRLDIDSEGLLLLTNDGDLARHLELPATGWSRKYKVRVQGRVDEKQLETIRDGVTVDGVRYGPIEARLEIQKNANAWLIISIREGKNREVRRIMEHLGHRVSRLIRLSYGPFQLGRLDKGEIEEIRPSILKEQLGLADSKSAKAGLASEGNAKSDRSRANKGKAQRSKPFKPGGSQLSLAKGKNEGRKSAKPSRTGAKDADHRRKQTRR